MRSEGQEMDSNGTAGPRDTITLWGGRGPWLATHLVPVSCCSAMMFLRLTPAPARGLTGLCRGRLGLMGPEVAGLGLTGEGQGRLHGVLSAATAGHCSGEENSSQRCDLDALWVAVEPPGGCGVLGCSKQTAIGSQALNLPAFTFIHPG